MAVDAGQDSVWELIQKFLGMIRFSHTVFALPFALLAAVMAWYQGAMAEPAKFWRWQELLGIVLCMVFARSAAMAFNRVIDRKFDAQNPRTAGRHLPSGALSLRTVVVFAIGSSVGFVLSTLCFWPNGLPLILSVPVLLFICGYSYAKRFTSLVHFWLGTALMLSPIAAWIAIRGEQVMNDPYDLLPALVLGAAILFWVSGFDIFYACQDVDYDRNAGLFSVPARFGVPMALRIAAGCHLLVVILLFALPLVFPWFGTVYWLGILAIAALLAYEHALVREDDLTRVNVAFFHVNAIISVGLLLLGMADLYFFGSGNGI